MKEYLKQLRRGCNEYILTEIFEEDEKFNTGWKCGNSTDEGLILYCKPCWKKIDIATRKVNKLERDVGE